MAKKEVKSNRLQCTTCKLELYPHDVDRHKSATGHKDYEPVKEG